MERGLIVECTRSALAFKREQGPPARLAVVRRILFLLRQGNTFAAIAATLDAEGARAKRGRSWHASTVWNVVQRRQVYVDAQKAS